MPQSYKRLINKEKERKDVIQIIDDEGFLREVSFDDLTSHPTTLAGYGITDAYISNGTIYLGNQSITPASVSSLGTAAYKDYTASVIRGSTDLPTSDAVFQAIGAAVSSALYYRGISSTIITDGGTETAVIDGQPLVVQSGDVVIYSGFEFLWENNVWNKLGDDTSFALKTIQVAGDGTYITGGGQLTQNQTLTLSNSVIASLGKADTAVQPAALGDYLPLTAGSSKALTGNLYLNLSNPTIFGNVSGSYYSMLELSNNGSLFIGNDQIANGKATYVKGSSIYFTWGASDSAKSARFMASTLRPSTADSGLTLGTSSYKWSAVYADTLIGNLDLSYLQNADDLKAIEALSGTGLAKRTADNTWELTDTADKAKELVTSTEEDAMFTSRQVPSVAVGDVCKITSVKGKSVVWNQLVQVDGPYTFTVDGLTITYSRGHIHIEGTTTASSRGRTLGGPFSYIANHRYYIKWVGDKGGLTNAYSRLILNNPSDSAKIITATASASYRYSFIIYYQSDTAINADIDYEVIDLTAADLDSLTVEEFEALYPLPYYDYNAGELVNNAASGVEMLDAGSNSLGTIPLNITGLTSNGVQIFPDGMKSAGSVADEWSGTTAVKRIGVVDLGTLTWTQLMTGRFRAAQNSVPYKTYGTSGTPSICARYEQTRSSYSTASDKTFLTRNDGYFFVIDSAYTDAATFKAAMSGVLLYYELAEPETYTVDALPDILVPFDAQGTQRRLPEDTASSVSAPMVCDFQYGANIGDVIKSINNNTEEYRKKSDNNFANINTEEIHCTGDIEANGNLTINDVIASAINAQGEMSIPTQMPSTIELGRVFMYYDEAVHQLCIRESDGTIKTIQFT